MFKRGLLISCLGFATVMLFQNCGGAISSGHIAITSSPELAKLAPQNCSKTNLHCSKRRYSPAIENTETDVRECLAIRGQQICLTLPFHSYNSSGSSSEVADRIEYSCWLGPVSEAAGYALRRDLAPAADAALAACEAGLAP